MIYSWFAKFVETETRNVHDPFIAEATIKYRKIAYLEEEAGVTNRNLKEA